MFATHDEYQRALSDATRLESLDRARAFLGVNESIGEFEVVPMTLRHYSTLQIIGSPFIPPFETPSITDITQFLWLLSPDFSPTNHKGRKSLLKRCEKFAPISEPRFKTKRAMAKWELKSFDVLARVAVLIGNRDNPEMGTIRGFVKWSLADRPQGSRPAIPEPDYFSDAAAICAILGKEFGYGQDEVLDMPLKRTFQFLKVNKWLNQENPLLSNPSDDIKTQWLRGLNQRRFNAVN